MGFGLNFSLGGGGKGKVASIFFFMKGNLNSLVEEEKICWGLVLIDLLDEQQKILGMGNQQRAGGRQHPKRNAKIQGELKGRNQMVAFTILTG